MKWGKFKDSVISDNRLSWISEVWRDFVFRKVATTEHVFPFLCEFQFRSFMKKLIRLALSYIFAVLFFIYIM